MRFWRNYWRLFDSIIEGVFLLQKVTWNVACALFLWLDLLDLLQGLSLCSQELQRLRLVCSRP